MIETLAKATKEWLESSPDLIALIGPRIYPLHLPQSCVTFPAVVYRIASQSFSSDLDGGDGTMHARIRLLCIADSYAEAEPVALAIRALDSVDPPAGFDRTLFAGEADDANLIVPGSDQRRVQIAVEFEMSAQVPV